VAKSRQVLTLRCDAVHGGVPIAADGDLLAGLKLNSVTGPPCGAFCCGVATQVCELFG